VTGGRGLVFRDVEVDGRRVDVRVAGGVIEGVGSDLPAAGAEVVDGGGGALVPGLHDHHIHLLATAAAEASVPVGPADVGDAAGLAAALRGAAARTPPGGWVRAVGYHESVAGDLDRATLDQWVPDTPVRVQHRTGGLWMLNGAALAAVAPIPADDGDGPGTSADTGRFFRADRWLADRWPTVDLDLAALGRRLAAYGVTGVTDATPFATPDGPRRLGAAVAAGDLPQHVTMMGGPALVGTPAPPGLTPGPVKLLLHDHDLPPLDVVVGWVSWAHGAGRPVAVHSVTLDALVVTIAALQDAGPMAGDRIEHAAIVPPAFVADLLDLGVAVVTQPSFVRERGDGYLTEVDEAEQPDLWRCGTLASAGVPVAAGTDAPYGPLDPWVAIRAATTRRTRAGVPLGPDEAVPPRTALALFLGPADRPGGPPRRVVPGAPADLALLRAPLADAIAEGPGRAEPPVRRTYRAGAQLPAP